ncbi:ectoine synthase [Burkholderia ambifaria]|jgi:L-ectoine synthase|uniref:ectoine synthase n=2 Tax=Burkholderia ambifaria TaxID=152480 RepID=UPI001B9878A9|nr:ectoine synthase [Burkholderia ambifaria]MBR8330171.1 ectoine synthase [Burkholderia ambifaria]
MIVVKSADIANTERHARGPGWDSKRMIVKQDGVGYSVHETRVREGAELHLHYKNHFETNYCVAGEGEVVDTATGDVHRITPGTIYALNLNDPHILRATRGDLHLVCVFNPPLTGLETHREDGSYALPTEQQA